MPLAFGCSFDALMVELLYAPGIDGKERDRGGWYGDGEGLGPSKSLGLRSSAVSRFAIGYCGTRGALVQIVRFLLLCMWT